MYTQPPSRAEFTVNHVVGLATGIIVPAAGVGTALRIYGVSFGISRTSTGIVDILIRDGANDVFVGLGMQLTGTSNQGWMLPYPGYQCDENSDIVLETRSTAATGFSIAVVLYYEDPV